MTYKRHGEELVGEFEKEVLIVVESLKPKAYITDIKHELVKIYGPSLSNDQIRITLDRLDNKGILSYHYGDVKDDGFYIRTYININNIETTRRQSSNRQITGMTHEELVERAEYLSGKPARKNRHGSGALRWLAMQLDVSQSTISRWGSNRTSPVPGYALRGMDELERQKNERERLQAAGK